MRCTLKILDSDHCIAILRGQLDLRDWVLPSDELAVTSINVAELIHGAHKSSQTAKHLAQVDVLLAAFRVLPFDEQAARRCGWLKATLEKAGAPLHLADLQIAAIALRHNLPLVTHNEKHFRRIPNLQLEDWLA